MSVITFPSTLNLARMTWGTRRRDVVFTSPFGSQAVEISGPLWEITINPPPALEANSGAWKALTMQLAGKVNQLAIWDMNRPEPIGTMRGTMTLNADIAQGATSMSIIASGQAGTTLVNGDLIGIGTGTQQQVVMVTNNPTADGSGIIAVNFAPWVRNAFAGGYAVTWSKPAALFRMVQSSADWEYGPGRVTSSGAIALVEDWR